LEAFLVSIVVVAVGEIGDKTQLLALMLAARLRKPLCNGDAPAGRYNRLPDDLLAYPPYATVPSRRCRGRRAGALGVATSLSRS
jgi:hypothetical protein